MSRSSNHNTDSRRYNDWLFHAFEDYLAADVLHKEEKLQSICVFHCQQCFEKSLKAFLLYKNKKLFDGHNLTWLCKQAAMIDTDFMRWLTKSTMLNRYYIETRYPADIPLTISYDDADDILSCTREMLFHICELLKFDYRSYHRRKPERRSAE